MSDIFGFNDIGGILTTQKSQRRISFLKREGSVEQAEIYEKADVSLHIFEERIKN